MQPESPAFHVLGELAVGEGVVSGWCWSPARPTERMRVELVIDGRVVGRTVAARLRLDLARESVCDGYHGFSLPLPSSMPMFSMIEVREWQTGQAFGRILGAEMADVRQWAAQTGALFEYSNGLHTDLSAGQSRLTGETLQHAMEGSAALIGHARGIPKHDRGIFPAGFQLPWISNPAVTLVLDATGASAATVASVYALAPLLRPCSAELIVLDDGRGTASAGLAQLPNLIYCHAEEPTNAGRLVQAVSRVRAPTMAILRAGHVSPLGISLLLQHASAGQRMMIGNVVADIARRAGMGELFPVSPLGASLRTGLTLLAPMDVFGTLASLDPALEDRAGLPALVFALAAWEAGQEVEVWGNDPIVDQGPSAGLVAARHRFATLWGGHDGENSGF